MSIMKRSMAAIGRVEVRRYWTVTVLPEITEAAKWEGLQTIGMVESERHIEAKVTRETRYYISSLDSEAKRFGRAVRGHWGIDNRLHWSLDVTFNEDGCRIRQGQAAESFSVLRHLALNLLQQDKTTRLGIKAKWFKAALDPQYLAKLLIIQ